MGQKSQMVKRRGTGRSAARSDARGAPRASQVSSDDGKKFQGGRVKRPRLRRASTNKKAFRDDQAAPN
jgi:hypothetical protein